MGGGGEINCVLEWLLRQLLECLCACENVAGGIAVTFLCIVHWFCSRRCSVFVSRQTRAHGICLFLHPLDMTLIEAFPGTSDHHFPPVRAPFCTVSKDVVPPHRNTHTLSLSPSLSLWCFFTHCTCAFAPHPTPETLLSPRFTWEPLPNCLSARPLKS